MTSWSGERVGRNGLRRDTHRETVRLSVCLSRKNKLYRLLLVDDTKCTANPSARSASICMVPKLSFLPTCPPGGQIGGLVSCSFMAPRFFPWQRRPTQHPPTLVFARLARSTSVCLPLIAPPSPLVACGSKAPNRGCVADRSCPAEPCFVPSWVFRQTDGRGRVGVSYSA